MLKQVKDPIQNILDVLSTAIDIDSAVIDDKFKLVAYTDGYIEKKGTEVHELFVEKVFELGEIVVSTPGCTEYCEGCRFQNNCPAAMELLMPITLHNKNIGVLSFSFFSSRDMNIFESNLNKYRALLVETSKLMAKTVLLNLRNDHAQSEKTAKSIDDFRYTLNSIIGSHPTIEDLKSKIKKISKSPSAVLIIGETGTGKELFARAIHSSSHRQHKPFMPINCAAIPESLLESELFGYEEGAFSGAKRKGKCGLFELANGGTLFLDEIGDMPLHLQAKLLRVLQDHQIRRIGGSKFIHLDVRIVAATNQNIEKLIAEDKFRSDLYYRLNIINLNIPALRDRFSDIELLAHYFLKKYAFDFRLEFLGFEEGILSIFKQYDWPGNVRELENAIEYMVNIEESKYLTYDSLPEKLKFLSTISNPSLQDQVDAYERKVITDALDRHGYDLSGKEKAASELNIGLRTLYRKVEKLAIESTQ
ncbi:MAG: sigma 54-interacting transcriptional regulator [Clostridia bacterium]|nr:sigma 54-interacting transcriptional regulator [Clostridia bacterium]